MDFSKIEPHFDKTITLTYPLIVPMISRGNHSMAEDLDFKVVTPDLDPKGSTQLLLNLAKVIGERDQALTRLQSHFAEEKSASGRLMDAFRTNLDTTDTDILVKGLQSASEEVVNLRTLLSVMDQERVVDRLAYDGFRAEVSIEEFVFEAARGRPFLRHIEVEMPAGATLVFDQDPDDVDLNPELVRVTFENPEIGVKKALCFNASELDWADQIIPKDNNLTL